jgi:peptidoglycan hydrolase-like protein with peptidoglycan-binding domain
MYVCEVVHTGARYRWLYSGALALIQMEDIMANPGQPTIRRGAEGEVVRRLQRALHRTPDPGVKIDGIFGPQTEVQVKHFQQVSGLVVDGIVGPLTWAKLPNGGPMPLLQQGSDGAVVSKLQQALTNGAPGKWITTPQGIDGKFGPHTKQSVDAFQAFGHVAADGIVGDHTWAVQLGAAGDTLESEVGLNFVL